MCKECGCGSTGHMHEQVFTVPEMMCENCEKTVKGAVLALAGVMSCAVDLTAKEVTVSYDANEVAANAIKKAIEDTGFDVTAMSEAKHGEGHVKKM